MKSNWKLFSKLSALADKQAVSTAIHIACIVTGTTLTNVQIGNLLKYLLSVMNWWVDLFKVQQGSHTFLLINDTLARKMVLIKEVVVIIERYIKKS